MLGLQRVCGNMRFGRFEGCGCSGLRSSLGFGRFGMGSEAQGLMAFTV